MSAAVRLEHSEVTGSQLARALAQAQAAFPAVKKTRTAKVGAYSYQYADLSDLMHAVLPVLGKHGLALTQRYSCVEGVIFVETCLLHVSGEILSSMLPVSSGEKTPQQVGSLMTYMRRYAISALLGIASEDDDDAQSANDMPPKRDDGRDLSRHAPAKAAQPPPPKQQHGIEPAPFEAWADEVTGIGKNSKTTFTIDGAERSLKDVTWRQLAAGSLNGRRYKWLVDTLHWCEEQENPGKPLRVFMERAPVVLGMIEGVQ